MDRRQQKTRKAIFQAFGTLLEKKRFEHITVQEIAERANIGRSTFYAHFETKDELLCAMCKDIFHHVFAQKLPVETDDARPNDKNLEAKLGHILYHLRENPLNLKGLLASESGELFIYYFKSCLRDLFSRYLSAFQSDVPTDFLIHYLVGSFSETVYWWVKKDMSDPPDTVAAYYLSMIQIMSQST